MVIKKPTWEDVSTDSLTRVIEKFWSPHAETSSIKFDMDVVENIYFHEIFKSRKRFNIRKVMLLEFSQYLENYLWPNFGREKNNVSYIMSIVVMINEKFRQRVSSIKILESRSDIFPIFFDLFLHQLLENKYNIVEKTQAIMFLNNAFNSLEIDFVRKCVQKLVSLTTWTSIIENRREAEFTRVPKLRKLYNALMRKEKKFLDQETETGKLLYEKSVFDRLFISKLLSDFKEDVLDEITREVLSSTIGNFSQTFYDRIHYAERFLELMIDLEAHLPNRRFFKILFDASHTLTWCTLSPLNLSRPVDLITDKLSCPKTDYTFHDRVFDNLPDKFKDKAKLFGQLLQILKFYHDFEINDITGEALTEDEKTDLHYDKIASLQRICFKEFRTNPVLLKLALSNVCKIDTRRELVNMLAPLSLNLLIQLAIKLNLLDPSVATDNEKGSTPYNKEFLLELIVSRHEKRPSQVQAINDMPLYPTEKVLWDQNLVPDDFYTGEDCLALPKLNLQFLTLHDYLLRNFKLFQLETMYEIRQDVQDALFRLKPWVSENPDQIPVVFGGWARMAAQIDTLSIIDIGKPEMGDDSTRNKPSRVRADVTVNLNLRDDVRSEWLTLRKHDVCFLIGLKPTKPYGYKYKPLGIYNVSGGKGKGGIQNTKIVYQNKRIRNEDHDMPVETEETAEDLEENVQHITRQDDETNFPAEFGVHYIRGCEIEGMLDVDGKVIEEGPRAKGHTLPTGKNRTWRVLLDTNQYSQDIDTFALEDVLEMQEAFKNFEQNIKVTKKKNKFSYDETTFHVILRRKPKENNFKAVLDTIRRIMNITQGRPGSLEETYNEPMLSSSNNVRNDADKVAITGKESTNNQVQKTTPTTNLDVCEEMVVPHWLHDIILGFGDPDSAAYHKVFEVFNKKYPTLLGLDGEGYLDFRDTFLDRDHLIDTLSQDFLVEFVEGESTQDVKDIQNSPENVFYKIKFPSLSVPTYNVSNVVKSDQNLESLHKQAILVKKYPVKTFGPPAAKLTLPRNFIKFTPTQVQAIKAGLLPGLTLVVGPPGTGKTDLAVQIAKLLYHNRPTERILVITHSNQALNQIFAKLAPSIPGSCSACDEAHLLRLGHGEAELQTDKDFGKYGRVDHVLCERLRLLDLVHGLRDSLYDIKRESEIMITNPYSLYNVDTDNMTTSLILSGQKPKDTGKDSKRIKKEVLDSDTIVEEEETEDIDMLNTQEKAPEPDKNIVINKPIAPASEGDMIQHEIPPVDEPKKEEETLATIEAKKETGKDESIDLTPTPDVAVEETSADLQTPIESEKLVEQPQPAENEQPTLKFDVDEEDIEQLRFQRDPFESENILTRDNIILESYRHFKPAPFTVQQTNPTDIIKNEGQPKQAKAEESLLSTSNYYRCPEISFTCETALYFYRYEILSRWEAFKSEFKKYEGQISQEDENRDRLLTEKIVKDFPFSKFIADILNKILVDPEAFNLIILKPPANIKKEVNGELPSFEEKNIFVPSHSYSQNWKIAQNYYQYIKQMFDQLEDFRAFEVLRTGPERVNYLLIRSAKIIAMTCTHAALRRGDLVKLGFKYDTLIVEEAAQILEIESFIPLLLQSTKDNVNRLKRVVMIGDHNQLPPVIKNMAFKNFANMEQSLFTRLVRLGVPPYVLDAQGRAKPCLCDLYSWRYPKLGNLPHTYTELEYLRANAGFMFDFQLVDVQEFNGKGESEPTPHFYQNLAEAEYCVALFTYMRLIGYPAEKISILTTYNGQKHLIRDIVEKRCAENPLIGMPHKITTVDKYQGQQNDYIILSLVRTKATVGHLRDVRRLIVAVSRARLGLYIFARVNLFSRCLELTPVFKQLTNYPVNLHLLPWELYPGTRLINGKDVDGNNIKMPFPPLIIKDMPHMSQFVYQMYNDKLKVARDLAMAAHHQSRTELAQKVVEPEILETPEIAEHTKKLETDQFAAMSEIKATPIEYVTDQGNIDEDIISIMPLREEIVPHELDPDLIKDKVEAMIAESDQHFYKSSLEAEVGIEGSSSDED